MDSQSPIRTKSSRESMMEHPNGTFFSNVQFGDDSSDLIKRRRYQTEQFPSYKVSSEMNGIFEDHFAAPAERFSTVAPRRIRDQRLRATSLSIPQTSISNAFGVSIFASGWEPVEDATEVNADPIEDNSDIHVLTSTIDYLGLDEPYASPSLDRIRSATFPAAADELFYHRKFDYSHMRSKTTSGLDEGPLDWHEEVPEWEEMADRYKAAASQQLSSQESDSPAQEIINPSRSLWIGNIDATFTGEELYTIFGKFGEIESIRMLPEKECAFVNFVKLQDALEAREKMQSGRIGNCIVKIGFGKTDALNETPGSQPTKSLWVGNISPSMKPTELEAMFAKYGQVESARVLTHKNCGFVNFVSVEDAILARNELNGRDINGLVMKIGFAKVPTAPLSVSEAMAQPAVIAGLVAGAAERVYRKPWTSLTNGMGMDMYSANHNDFNCPNDNYAASLPPLESSSFRKVDQLRLREIRKKLEGTISALELEQIFYEVIDDAVDLCSGSDYINLDYIGNVIIQKLMEKSSDNHRLALIEKVAPHLASLGVHKNGTWAVQKIIDCAKTTAQIDVIVEALTFYAPLLLLDQFGNYVIQGCLRLGNDKNQFIFDAMEVKCWELGQGRFGARAMKACLESQYTSKSQQKQVFLAIVQHCVQLSMNANGSLLLTWLFDSSAVPGRYRVIAPHFVPHLAILLCQKISSLTVLKIVNQRIENDARDIILSNLFSDSAALQQILTDPAVGVISITKILTSGALSVEERKRYSEIIRSNLEKLPLNIRSSMAHKRLVDELNTTVTGITREENHESQEFFPTPFASPNRVPPAEEQLPPRYPSANDYQYPNQNFPTPSQSPVPYYPYYPYSYPAYGYAYPMQPYPSVTQDPNYEPNQNL